MDSTLRYSAPRVTPDVAIIHDTSSFRVQWSAENLGPSDTPEFVVRLVVRSRLPNGCPHWRGNGHPVVYDSTIDGDPSVVAEPAILVGTAGPQLALEVGAVHDRLIGIEVRAFRA